LVALLHFSPKMLKIAIKSIFSLMDYSLIEFLKVSLNPLI